MSSPTIWSAGRYDAVGDRIAPIAAEVVAAVDRRRPLSGAAVADLACGTGSAALAAAAAGAQVTAVDITPELLAIGAQKADSGGRAITWVTARRLRHRPARRVVRCRGVEHGHHLRRAGRAGRRDRPPAQAGRRPGFSSWVRDPDNPFFSPIVAVLGPPPASDYSPDQWGVADTIIDRLAADFDDVEIQSGTAHMAIGHRRRGHVLVGARVADARLPARQPRPAPSATSCWPRSRTRCARTPAPTASWRSTPRYVVVTARRR